MCIYIYIYVYIYIYIYIYIYRENGNHVGRSYAHGLHGYVGASARFAPLGEYCHIS